MLRLAVDMKLFDVAAKANGSELRVDQIAAETAADPLLTGKLYGENLFEKADRSVIARVMRVLAGMGIFKEVGHDAFVSMPLVGAYVTGSPLTAGVVHMCVDRPVVSSTQSAKLPI